MKIIVKIYQSLFLVKRQLLFSAFGYVSYCKHKPSCSVRALKDLKDHGTIVGLFLSLKRIITCI